ncbi:low temperature requirement protein A [Actinomyces sp. Z5]|uniref:low temperature requirement protein A n=1 Tax=Actinomyces sp. Z5 TaxID=2250216 RepID=UPI0015EC057D|nr:low temperature requirement protein A [Actinomyces sp. Z5]
MSSSSTPSPTHTALPHRPVDTVMLFLDLVYVFAVAGISGLLRDNGALGLLHGAVVLAVIYWLWCITSIQASMRDVTTNHNRLVVLALALVTLAVAITVPHAFGTHALAFALACWAARGVLLIGMVGTAWRVFTPDLVGVVLTGPLLVAGALLGGNAQLGLWGAAALLELVSPSLQRRRMRAVSYDAENVVERFGLLVIVALGETVVGIGEPLSEAEAIDWRQAVAVIAAFALVGGLWWSYFHHSSGLVLRLLETAGTPFDVVREVLVYGHLVLIGGIIAVAAGFHSVLEEPDAPMGWKMAVLLCLGVAAFLAVFLHVRARVFSKLYRSRLAGMLAAALLAPLAATTLPGWAALAAAAGIALVVSAWETLSPTSAGLPAPEDFR